MAEVKEITEKQVINIDEKDIERVNKFRSDFAEVTARIGEVEVERLNAQMILKNIEDAKDNLSEQFKSMRNEANRLEELFIEMVQNNEK